MVEIVSDCETPLNPTKCIFEYPATAADYARSYAAYQYVQIRNMVLMGLAFAVVIGLLFLIHWLAKPANRQRVGRFFQTMLTWVSPKREHQIALLMAAALGMIAGIAHTFYAGRGGY